MYQNYINNYWFQTIINSVNIFAQNVITYSSIAITWIVFENI